MNRIESQEKTIDELLKRNLYLESILFGKTKQDDNIFESKIVYVVVESKSNSIRGVFLDEMQAQYSSVISDCPCDVDAWSVQASAIEYVPPVIIPAGTKITYESNGKSLEGSIIGSDNDLSNGIEKVIYKVAPKNSPFDFDSPIILFHSEIVGIGHDDTKA